LQDFREDLKSLQKLRLLDVSQNSISVVPEVLIVKPISQQLDSNSFCLSLQLCFSHWNNCASDGRAY
jgi:Leucine-rich repeat (LRR) protein